MKTWVIVGASRGIGKGFVQQALDRGDQIHASVRKPEEQTVAALWPHAKPGQCHVYACDMLSETSIHVRSSTKGDLTIWLTLRTQ